MKSTIVSVSSTCLASFSDHLAVVRDMKSVTGVCFSVDTGGPVAVSLVISG